MAIDHNVGTEEVVDNQRLIDSLHALVSERPERPTSEAARMRAIFDEIEAAIETGVTREQIWRALSENGLKLSFTNFQTTFYRIRKERKLVADPTPPTLSMLPGERR